MPLLRQVPAALALNHHCKLTSERGIVAQQLNVLQNSRCQLLLACTHCDACAQWTAFVFVQTVCPRGGISIDVTARKFSSQHACLLP